MPDSVLRGIAHIPHCFPRLPISAISKRECMHVSQNVGVKTSIILQTPPARSHSPRLVSVIQEVSHHLRDLAFWGTVLEEKHCDAAQAHLPRGCLFDPPVHANLLSFTSVTETDGVDRNHHSHVQRRGSVLTGLVQTPQPRSWVTGPQTCQNPSMLTLQLEQGGLSSGSETVAHGVATHIFLYHVV